MISRSNPGLYIPFSPADNKWNLVLLDGATAPEHSNAHPFKKPWDLPPLWTGKTLNILPLNLRVQLPILPKEMNMDTQVYNLGL